MPRLAQILPANDARSLINKFNVPATCGRCHADVQSVFIQSIHGQAIARGNGLAPVCTDCHGIHTIKAPSDPNSSVSDQNLSRTTCARCHQGVRLTQEFGVAGSRVSTYLDSYHGLASQGGSVVVANCASCHGVHNILPSSDPRSTINPANLDATCGQCHKGVTQKFTRYKVHVDVQGGRTMDKGTRRGPLDQVVLSSAHPAGHRRNVPAQRNSVARQGNGTAQGNGAQRATNDAATSAGST